MAGSPFTENVLCFRLCDKGCVLSMPRTDRNYSGLSVAVSVCLAAERIIFAISSRMSAPVSGKCSVILMRVFLMKKGLCCLPHAHLLQLGNQPFHNKGHGEGQIVPGFRNFFCFFRIIVNPTWQIVHITIGFTIISTGQPQQRWG